MTKLIGLTGLAVLLLSASAKAQMRGPDDEYYLGQHQYEQQQQQREHDYRMNEMRREIEEQQAEHRRLQEELDQAREREHIHDFYGHDQ